MVFDTGLKSDEKAKKTIIDFYNNLFK